MDKLNNQPKKAVFEYGTDYQLKQTEKYRNRKHNHWKFRIDLAHNLVEQHVLVKQQGKSKKDIVVVDVGCSIGTFAIEFAKLGYNSYGVDFDSSAIDIAKQLSAEENVTPEFVCGDISDWCNSFPPIDIAICFDILEHLHDDELGSFLCSIRKQFSENGSLVFHTFPTQYNYIFFQRRYVSYPLIPFSKISQPRFNKIVKLYSKLLDMSFLLKHGKTHKEAIKCSRHCNPTTNERLTDILNRAGYEIVFMESANLYNFKESVQKRFSKQPITFRNLYGVAVPKP